MKYWFYTVWMAITGNLEQYMTAVTEYRRVEWEIYRSRFGKKFMTTTHERRRLLEESLPLSDRTKDVILSVGAPNLNGYAEAWIGSLKRECLNHFLIFGVAHLRHPLRE